MTIVEIVVEILPIALSVIAFIISIVTKNKKMATKSIEQIQNEGQALMQKYIDKQCKKNKVEQTSTTNSSTNNQSNYY